MRTSPKSPRIEVGEPVHSLDDEPEDGTGEFLIPVVGIRLGLECPGFVGNVL